MERVAVCICILIASSLAAAPAYFVPFGSSNGDQILYRNDDGSSSALAFNYRFFGRTYNALYVNNNGLISFSGPVSSYTASGLAGLSYPAICPFWADVDTRPSNGGYVYYRSTTNAAQLNQVSEFIRQTRSPTFVGVRMFVVTWDSVGYYSNHVEKLNTFQAVLIADEGDFSFVVFNYGDIKWVTGDASGGSGGFGGTGAAVGFGSGSSTNYAQVDGSLTNTIVSVNTRSNVQYAGRYVYQVNEGVVINRCCDTSSPPVLTPVTSMVLSCTDAIPAAPTVTATFSCTTPATSTVPVVETVSINGCNKVITRTWTATDSCLRSSRVIQTITVTDRDAPILTLPSADRNVVSCTSSTSPSVTGFATATDACSANVQVTYSDAAPTATATCSADNNNIRSSFIRTWTATDSCGNSVSEGQVIQIQDINAPVYDSSFRSTVTFECGATSGIDSTSSSVSDCNTFTESKVDVVSSSNCMSIASIQREYTLTDSCGNSRSYPQQITIQDTIAPTVVSEDSCIFPLNRKYACFDLSAPFFVQGSDQCSSNLRYNYAGNCVDNLGRRKYCVVHENQLCMKAAPGIESYTLSYLVTDECGHSTPTSATFHLGSGVNCRVPDTRVIDSCDGAADDFADAEVSIDQVSIDLWGGQDAPQQYRVSATVTFATPLQDWRVVVVLPSDTDSVVHYGEYYSVYNGEVFVCEDEGVFTVKPAGDWVRGQSSVVFEYVVSNTQGYSEADIRSLTEFAVFTTI